MGHALILQAFRKGEQSGGQNRRPWDWLAAHFRSAKSPDSWFAATGCAFLSEAASGSWRQTKSFHHFSTHTHTRQKKTGTTQIRKKCPSCSPTGVAAAKEIGRKKARSVWKACWHGSIRGLSSAPQIRGLLNQRVVPKQAAP